jgi:hypothetical protein
METLRCVAGHFVTGKRMNYFFIPFSYYIRETGGRNAISTEEFVTDT